MGRLAYVLKHHLAGWWSRRINDEHRLVYRIHDGIKAPFSSHISMSLLMQNDAQTRHQPHAHHPHH